MFFYKIVMKLLGWKVNPITPKDYTDNVWNRDRSGMKKLKPNEVFEKIIEKL